MKTPALEHLMGAYFHQDWFDGGDEWATLNHFVAGSPSTATALPDEIAEVLRRYPADSELEAFLAALGCEYTADPDAGGYRAWLTEIARRVAAATA